MHMLIKYRNVFLNYPIFNNINFNFILDIERKIISTVELERVIYAMLVAKALNNFST